MNNFLSFKVTKELQIAIGNFEHYYFDSPGSSFWYDCEWENEDPKVLSIPYRWYYDNEKAGEICKRLKQRYPTRSAFLAEHNEGIYMGRRYYFKDNKVWEETGSHEKSVTVSIDECGHILSASELWKDVKEVRDLKHLLHEKAESLDLAKAISQLNEKEQKLVDEYDRFRRGEE